MDQVEEIKAKVDIVDVITSYIPLKKAGRNFSGLCPFHSEKSPSFMVSPERQVFKCFGCSESGDVITFLEKIEGWEFREALEELAKKTGVKLRSGFSGEKTKAREKLLSINKLVEKFYSHLLLNHPAGEVARKYLENRGIDKGMWKHFSLGYAAPGWDNVFNLLVKRKFDLVDIAASGLVIARGGSSGGGYYDRFRNRLMFPLRDLKGDIVGFSGRIINSGDSPKYLNSPQTLIFEKGATLFGLYEAKSEIRKKNEVILVEGEFDVISPYSLGIENIVASKGTALTERQVAAISRLTENVVICYDMDAAGDIASHRGIELLEAAGVSVRVARLGNFKDPDEFVKADRAGFEKAIRDASNIYDYFIESAVRRFDVSTAYGKKNIGKEVVPVISKIGDDIVRAHYIDKLAKVLDLDVSLIRDAVLKKQPISNADLEKGDLSQPSHNSSIEEYFLALLVGREEIIIDKKWELDHDDFENLTCSGFYKWLRGIIGSSKQPKSQNILKKLPDEFEEFVNNLYLVNISPAFFEKEEWALEIIKAANRIKFGSIKRKMKKLSSEIKLAETLKDDAKVEKLSGEIVKLKNLLKDFTNN